MSKKRGQHSHLPKVQDNPGELWRGGPTPLAGESLLRTVGQAGPSARARYFGNHKTAAFVARAFGLVLVMSFVAAAIAIAVQ